MKKIPDHILEAINCKESVPSDFYAEYGEENVKSALEELKKSDEEILKKITPGQFYDDVMSKKNQNGKSKKLRLMNFVPIAAAAAFVLIFTPIVVTGRMNRNSVSSDSGVRIKGQTRNPEIILYRQNSNAPELLKNNEKVFSGDSIQIAFNPSGKKYCLIFSIDGSNQITPHLSQNEDSLNPCEVENKLSLLSYSYELDDAPEYELFVMITSDSFIELSEQIKNLAGKSLEYIQNGKYLPSSAEITTFMLKK